MSNGDAAMQNRYRRAQYLRHFGFMLLGALVMLILWRFTSPLSVDLIWIQYPANQDPPTGPILIVERYKTSRLIEAGAERTVRRGSFEVDTLFQQLLGQLVNTWDEDKRVDERVGTVRIWFSNGTSGTFLIYDKRFADEMFDWARTNVVGKD